MEYTFFAGPRQGCGGILQGPTGQFESVNSTGSGRKYAPGLNCTWQIMADEGKVIKLEFIPPFELEDQSDDKCTFDFLEVSENHRNSIVFGIILGVFGNNYYKN